MLQQLDSSVYIEEKYSFTRPRQHPHRNRETATAERASQRKLSTIPISRRGWTSVHDGLKIGKEPLDDGNSICGCSLYFQLRRCET